MPLDFIDIETSKTKSQTELEVTNAELQTRINELDSALFELLMKGSEEGV